ncbi:MAG TPA: hypothetical protein PK951_04830 [Chitinophagaceae bacterium]|nr:hypothetical protein [Chitinophagaceae bacterium]
MQRRKFIKNASLTVFSISAFGNLNWNGKVFEADTPTTTDILGPFYRPGAPMRTNLRLSGTHGTPIILKGRILKNDGTTPIGNALVEIWHCNENEVYDNTSDDYHYRGAQKTNAEGKYAFKSILPVPYKANANDESSWRPAHIHMRVSVPHQQDLITQIYFKDGKYVDTDRWSSSPDAVNRILKISKTKSGENEIIFNVSLSKEIPLDKKVYDKITGLYDGGDNNHYEFVKSDDLLFLKHNGQLRAAMKYKGNNTFVGGPEYPNASFELLQDGNVNVVINWTADRTSKGKKFIKYN